MAGADDCEAVCVRQVRPAGRTILMRRVAWHGGDTAPYLAALASGSAIFRNFR